MIKTFEELESQVTEKNMLKSIMDGVGVLEHSLVEDMLDNGVSYKEIRKSIGEMYADGYLTDLRYYVELEILKLEMDI